MRLLNPRHRNQPGFTLLEVIVAMTLLATSLVAIAGFAAINSRRARGIGESTQVTTALQAATNQYIAMPYDWLASGSTTFTTPFPHTRRVAVTPEGARTSVMIKIVPTNSLIPADSIRIVRTRPGSSPLHKTD
jgi:prepilin-type N-terminal cleavage/methylation domain-containing protein